MTERVPGKRHRALTKAEIEAAAAALGLRCLLSDGSKWTLNFRPHIRWPQDYTERERKMFRKAATAALEAAAMALRGQGR